MGTLMVLTMIDARLISLADMPKIADDSVVNVNRKSMSSEWDEPSVPPSSPRIVGPSLAEQEPEADGRSTEDSNPF